MRLVERYHFFVSYNPATGGQRSDVSFAEAAGVYFICPKCPNHHGVLCWFEGKGVPADLVPGPGRWRVSDDSTGAENLTLTPSVNVGCWHGFVRKGELIDA